MNESDLLKKLASNAWVADRVVSNAMDTYLRTGKMSDQWLIDVRMAMEDIRKVLGDIEQAGIAYRSNQDTMPINLQD